MTISKDRVKPSPQPDSWKLKEIFSTGIVLGGYMALMTVVFFWIMRDTDFCTVRTYNIDDIHPLENLLKFLLTYLYSLDSYLYSNFVSQRIFHVESLKNNNPALMSALYLQVSIISQALIFVTRSQSWSFAERPGFLLVTAFVVAQLVSIHFLFNPTYNK